MGNACKIAYVCKAVLLLLLCLLLFACGERRDASFDGTDATAVDGTDKETETEAALPSYTGDAQLQLPDMTEQAKEERGKLLIAIDAGHGQKDVGVIGCFGDEDVYESAVNLALALRLEQLLTEMGYRVLMIRRDNTAVLGGNGNEYQTDAEANARREAAVKAGADLYISLHCNSASDAAAWGSRLYYNGHVSAQFAGGPIATCYRTVLNEVFVAEIEAQTFRAVQQNYLNPMKDPYIVLKDKHMPAFLFEVGFMTNEQDFLNLTDSDFLWKYAYAVAVGTDMARAEGRLQ